MILGEHPREDYFFIDEVSHEQYPEYWMADDLSWVEPKIVLSRDDGVVVDVDWSLAKKTYHEVVDYVFRRNNDTN